MSFKSYFPLHFMSRTQLLILLIAAVSVITIVVFNLDKDPFVNEFDNNLALQNGDLVFRKGRSVESQMVLFSDQESDYSHVGIVYMIEGEAYVIHTVPDELESSIDYIKMEKIEEFFNSEKASKGSVLRTKTEYISFALLAAQKAKCFYDRKIIFDDAFDLKTEDKLYCTELVWKAYQENGVDLVQGKFDKLFLPISKGDMIFPSSLLKSHYLNEIYKF